MGQMWSVSLEDYLLAVELAKKNGKVAGDSIEEEFLFIMKIKNRKPICETDMTKEELLKDFKEKGIKAVKFDDLVREYRKYKDKGESNENK